MKRFQMVMAVAISACTPILYGSLHPYVSQDGRQQFRFVASKAAGDETHKDQIASELGRRQYCMNGWDVLSVDRTADPNFVIYEGACRR